ncbi:MAG: hypothetical protein LBP80_00045 [Treponema sp.]|jgi:fermentation-respiration switch protein FrsA (DUF1100 family)|nr:hypothetical protein [Treponema sp.]
MAQAAASRGASPDIFAEDFSAGVDYPGTLAFSETAYAAAEPKELYIVPGAMRIDLYDDVIKIPFDKLESFFNKAFNAEV